MPTKNGFVVASVIVLSAVGLFAGSQAQVGRPAPFGGPSITRANLPKDYDLFHFNNGTYRYDSASGALQMLTTVPAKVGIGYEWVSAAEEQGVVAPGAPGRYQVEIGDGTVGILVRIDKQFGTTWVASSNNGVTKWNLATNK